MAGALDEIAMLQAASVKHPNSARVHHNLGTCLEQAGDLAGAAISMRQALALNDAPVKFHLSLARVLRKLELPDEETAVLQAARERHPDTARIHFLLATCLERAGDLTGAIAAMRKAVVLDDAPVNFYMGLAQALRKSGQLDEAAATWRAATVRHPTITWLHYQFGDVLELVGDLAGAAAAFGTCAKLDEATIDLLVKEAPDLAVSTNKEHPTGHDKVQDEHKHALVRLLAWQASKQLAEDAENLSSGEALDLSPWPVGHSRPLEAANPVVSPVVSETRPLLSVLIPAYEVKSAKWLTRCLESVLEQCREEDWAEVIVVDDCSVGDVARIVTERFAPRVKYVRNSTRLGLSGNFNRCISISTGKFIHILHQDDQVAPGFYDALLPAMSADDTLVAAFSSSMVIDEKDSFVTTQTIGSTHSGPPEHWLETIALR